jgi:recombination protein RecT
MAEAKKKETEVAVSEESLSTRFMNKVIAEFTGGVGEPALTNFQKRLAQNYFIAIDAALKKAEVGRMKKDAEYRDQLAITWNNVNMEQLARNVVAAARIGLDPALSNHVAMTAFKNNNLSKYDIVFIDGYRGVELKAIKYGLCVPDSVVVELVYSTDTFKPIKKDIRNEVETYEFTINNPFDRGEIVGGFYYHIYSNNKTKNKLVFWSIDEILKRKPKYASVEFWGGEKDEYKNGKKTGKKVQVEGWYKEMCYKTIYRAAFSDITIDSQKIDDDYLKLKHLEQTYDDAMVDQEVLENANVTVIDIDATPQEEQVEQNDVVIQPQVDTTEEGQQTLGGPGF